MPPRSRALQAKAERDKKKEKPSDDELMVKIAT